MWGTMENRLNETGDDFGTTPYLPKSRDAELITESVCRKEPVEDLQKSIWKNPEASRRLCKQLLELVNSKEEYELLQRDLAELEQLFPSPSKTTERRCCNTRS